MKYMDRVRSRTPDVSESGCIIPRSLPNTQGYTKVSLWGKQWLGHRLAWTLANGPIPDGYDVHHSCGRRRCVNPDHLSAITKLEHAQIHGSQITHCPHGHSYVPENTAIDKRGGRRCRECARIRTRIVNEKKRQASHGTA